MNDPEQYLKAEIGKPKHAEVIGIWSSPSSSILGVKP